MKGRALLLLLAACAFLCDSAAAQELRVGAGAVVTANSLDIEMFGRTMQESRVDDFRLALAIEVDITSSLVLGAGYRSRGMRYFDRQLNPDGSMVGWSNSQGSNSPFYQTRFVADAGYEIPLTLRYRLSSSPLVPYLCAEYSLGFLEPEGYAYSYRREGEWPGTISDVHAAEVGNRISTFTLGAGVEARVNSWFSFLMDIGLKQTIGRYVEEEFMRVREADVLTGKILLLFHVFGKSGE